MAIDFPDSPSVNDVFTVGSRTWQWDGSTWSMAPSTGVSAVTGTSLSVLNEFTLPTTDGTASQVMVTDGSGGVTWSDVTASPAGSSGEVQFNNAGSTAGASGLFYDVANDRLGIGTAAPVVDLHLAGDDDREALRLSGDGASGANQGSVYLGLHHWGTGTHPSVRIGVEENGTGDYDASLVFQTRNSDADVVPSTRVLIDQNGNVGIGAASPETPLNIVTTNKLGATFTGTVDGEGLRVDQSNYTANNYVSLVEAAYDDGQTAPHVRMGAQFTGSGSKLVFGTSNAYASGITNTALTVDQSGNVGIGTTSPDGEFELTSNTSEMIFSSSPNKTNRYRLDANFTDAADFGLSLGYWDGSAYQRTLTIDDSGKVGIGTTAPGYMLDVRGDMEIKEASPTLSLKDSDTATASNGSIVFRDSADTVLGRIQMNGNDDMGIQAVGAAANLYLYAYGDWRLRLYSTALAPYTDNVLDLGSTSKRYDDVYATNGTINTSDARDKADVIELDRGLDFINALNPVSFRWSDRGGYEGSRTHWGLLAQDVAEVLGDDAASSAVWTHTEAGEETDAEGNTYETLDRQGLRMPEMIAPLIKAVQELSAQNAELTARIEALEA